MTGRLQTWRHVVLMVSLVSSLALGAGSPFASFADSGQVLQVCPRGCTYSSVATALGHARVGDTIQVGPGIYLEHIMMRPGVTIRGEGNNVSIITGADADTVVRAYGTAIGRDAVLEGLTIIAGRSSSGAGIDIRGGASPTIRNNLITANNAPDHDSYGAGMFISGGAPLVYGNTFTKNSSKGGGGAIGVCDGSTAVITGNIFQDNKTEGHGGAISIIQSSPVVTGNRLIHNSAQYGGGVDMSDSAPEFSGNVIMYNTAFMDGGGVSLRNRSSGSISANTFMTNTSIYYGGGLYMDRSAPFVSNNTFEYNDADTGGGIYVERSSPLIVCNLVARNTVALHGAGISIYNASPTLDSNTIISNTAIVGGAGLGITGHSWPTVLNNTLAYNAVGLHGGAVYIADAGPTLINNLINNNSSGGQGGGIYIWSASPSIRNNTIVYNDRPGSGEGIYLGNSSVVTIANNIIVGNGHGIVAASEGEGQATTPVILRNDVWNNRSGNFVGVPQADNLSSDPLFVQGRDGPFYLSQVSGGQRKNSPAVDAGSESARDAGLDGRTTSVYDAPDTGIVDLGYHYRALFYRVYLSVVLGEQP